MQSNQTIKVLKFCPYCGGQQIEQRAEGVFCKICDIELSIKTVEKKRGEYIVLSVGKSKWNNRGNLIQWIKVQRKDSPKPLLFSLSPEKVTKADLKPSDVVYIAFPENATFTEKEDVIFAPSPTDIQYIGLDSIELTVPITLEQINFKDNELDAYIVYGKLEKVWNNGYFNYTHSGETFPVKTTFPSKGASSISIRIQDELWNKFNTGIDLSWNHNRIKKGLPVDMQKSVAIEVAGQFRVLYNRDGTCRLQNSDNIVITNQNLIGLKKVLEEDELSKRWKEVRKQIKEILELKHIISADEVQEILDKNNYAGKPEEVVKAITWKKSYDEEYFNYLKELSDADIIYFGEGSYFFKVDGKVIQEIPAKGVASYCFLGSVEDVVTKLKALDLTKTELWHAKKEMPKETLYFYRGRIVHNNFEQWSEDIQDFIKTGKAKLSSGTEEEST